MAGCGSSGVEEARDGGTQDGFIERPDADTGDDAAWPDAGPSERLDVSELVVLFGDDRVRDVLGVLPLEAWPGDLAGVEAAFGVGRACGQPSREIFIVEEAQARPRGARTALDRPVPRVTMTGCSTSTFERSSLFVVVSSDPARADQEDPIALWPVELMARDRATGEYSFYDLAPDADGVTRLQRTVRRGSEVAVLSRRAGVPMVEEPAATASCFGCHVQGAPLFNELAIPWTHWISELTPPLTREYGGETRALIAAATGDDAAREGEPGSTPSGAYDFDQTMRLALEQFARPHVGRALSAPGPRTVRDLLQSILCETELNHEAFPLTLFIDPDAVSGAALRTPAVPVHVRLPILVPTRSEIDRAIERDLVARGLVHRDVALAARVIDDGHDVFSARRCGLLPEADVRAGGSLANLDASLRQVLGEAARTLDDEPTRIYVDALLAPGTSRAELATHRDAYLISARARVRALGLSTSTVEGRAAFERRVWERVERAEAMFPGPESPLPRFEPL